jgi:hypothetical protein
MHGIWTLANASAKNWLTTSALRIMVEMQTTNGARRNVIVYVSQRITTPAERRTIINSTTGTMQAAVADATAYLQPNALPYTTRIMSGMTSIACADVRRWQTTNVPVSMVAIATTNGTTKRVSACACSKQMPCANLSTVLITPGMTSLANASV